MNAAPGSVLKLTLLGPPQVARADTGAVTLRSRKQLALLAYLAVEQHHPVSRDTLLNLLWPEAGEDVARNNLRVALADVRRLLGESDIPFLNATRHTVQFDPTSNHTLDVLAFWTLQAATRVHGHAALETCAACLARLEQAVALYAGDFLHGFSLPDSSAFEEWATIQREQLHQAAIEALSRLAAAFERQGNHAAQCRYARRQIELEPWHEPAHLQLMRGLALSGDRSAALAQYEACRRVLAEELGLEPSPELAAFAEQLRVAAPPPRRPAPPSPPAPRPELPALPEPARVYGRADELALLRRWLAEEGCRLVALLGIGGVGKTTLAAAAAHDLARRFDAVAWCSLLNTPPPDELLRDVLGQLAPGAPVDLPVDPEGQVGLLLETLRQARCLVVLDNLESILRPDEPGTMRPGYTAYAQLLHAAATSPHRSCVLLTSRERPQGLARLEEDLPQVRLLRLDGLDADAGARMLVARGLHQAGGAAGELVRRYSGNPLALRLVAQTVREVFDGDIRAFLDAETPIFDDIGAVLDQQVARLSPLERELLTWLAIQREPVPAAALRANLVSPGPPRAAVEALRALLRRSLVSQSGTGLALQNVVIEYLTDALVAQVVREITGELPPGAPGADDPAAALNRFALCKAQAKDYVRASQSRLILEPVAERARERLGRDTLVERLRAIITGLRTRGVRTPGYAAGNVLNLLLHLGADLRGADFARLCVWQADLRGATAAGANFAHADLGGSIFTDAFLTINAVTFSPTGRLLAAGTRDGAIHLWRTGDWQPVRIFTGHTGGVNWLAFSPDGHQLASASWDETGRIWDAETGQVLHVLHDGTGSVESVVFSPDGTRLATAGWDHNVRVWDATTGNLLQILCGHADVVQSVKFSPDGVLLASGSWDHTVRIWDAATGQLRHVLRGHTNTAHTLAFSADGAVLASGGWDHTVRIWDAATGQLRHVLRGHARPVASVAFSPDGLALATSGDDEGIRVWSVGAEYSVQMICGQPIAGGVVAYSPDGGLLASGAHDQTVRIWDARTGQPLHALYGYDSAVGALAYYVETPRTALLATSGNQGSIHLWDPRLGRPMAGLRGHRSKVRSLAFSPDGALLASGGADRIVYIWDVATRSARHVLDNARDSINQVTWSPDGLLLACAGNDGAVRLWNACTGYATAVLEGHTNFVQAVAFSPDGALLASGGSDQTVRVWDVATRRMIRLVGEHTSVVVAVAFTPDGRHIISVGWDESVHVWDLQSDTVVQSLASQRERITAMAFSLDGTRLATASGDHTIHLWDAVAGNLLHALHGHSASVESLNFGTAGTTLVSGSYDETIKLWDVATGACLTSMRVEGPYAGMNIAGVTGITEAQKAALRALGAIEEP